MKEMERLHFRFKSGHAMQVSKVIKEDWPIVVTYNRNILLLKCYIIKVLEYKGDLNRRITYVLLCVCESLLM